MSIDVKVTNNADSVMSAFEKQVERGLEAIGMTAEGYAKGACPVDTGRLRNSITYATPEKQSSGQKPAEGSDYSQQGTPDKGEVYIGTNVEYAQYIENGTSTIQAFHFLRDAANGHGDEYKALMQASLQ